PKAEEASHLFFGEALSSNFSSLFATHPPLGERIKRLESLPEAASLQRGSQVSTSTRRQSAAFDSPQSATSAFAPDSQYQPTPPAQKRNHLPKKPKSRIQNSPPAPVTHSSATHSALSLNPNAIVTNIGTTNAAHLDYARSLLAQLPQGIKDALKQQAGAKAIVYGLLLDMKNKGVRDRQLTQLKATEPPEILKVVDQMVQLIHTLDPRSRLPLVDLTIPSLRELAKSEFAHFFKQIQALVQADGRLSLSEYALQVVLMRRLEPYISTTPATTATPKITHTSIDTVWDYCLILLSGLANVGHSSLDEAAKAFQSGVNCLLKSKKSHSKSTVPAQPVPTNIPKMGNSLNQLVTAAPKIKQAIVDACAHTVLLDGEVTVKEAELLRAIVISLGCPIPPFLG
ncbi:MAG: hypothetical protein F6K16_36015, partial [Symploca sp. SIO2B6]|nr:hypothetical protein [Symploca sp. SIO2B6]